MSAASLSYPSHHLFSLRDQPSLLPSTDLLSAQELNLWQPTAQRNRLGKTQPFPFHLFPRGHIGTVTSSYRGHLFDMTDPSDAQAASEWNIADSHGADVQALLAQSMHSDQVPKATPGAEPTQVTEGADDGEPAEQAVAPESRRSSLMELSHGDRNAILALIASGLGPHRLLPRFATTTAESSAGTSISSPTAVEKSVISPTSANNADGMAGTTADDSFANGVSIHESLANLEDSPFDNSADNAAETTSAPAIETSSEKAQTAPDTTASQLFDQTPAESVADSKNDDDSASQESDALSPKSIRKTLPGPHHKLHALAQDVPLPESPAPVTAEPQLSIDKPVTVEEPTSFGDSVSLPDNGAPLVEEPSKAELVTIDEESDIASAIITVDPSQSSLAVLVDEPLDALPTPTGERFRDILNPQASSWIPDDAVKEDNVEFLPPSRPTSPVVSKHRAQSVNGVDKHSTVMSEADLINQCCPVPRKWNTPTSIGAFASGDLFDGFTLGGVHKAVLAHYSHHFATIFAMDDVEEKGEPERIVKDPSFAVFRQWIFGRHLFVKSGDAVLLDMQIHLKTLVQLWRFAARIQAPIFANTVADVILSKRFTATDLFDAADDIDAVLKMVRHTHIFRIIIAHAIILNGIQLIHENYDAWPKSLLWCVLSWLSMGKSTAVGTELFSKAHPCAYHFHVSGHDCRG